MSTVKPSISDARRLLENPYAYVEVLGVDDFETGVEVNPATHSSTAALGTAAAHPYARIIDVDELDNGAQSRLDKLASGPDETETSSVTVATKPRRNTRTMISASVRGVHRRLWSERHALWDGHPPSDPVDLLDPVMALQSAGFTVEVVPGLGQTRSGSQVLEVAGVLDALSRRVRISARVPEHVGRFTLAHELGHVILHGGMAGLHRDVGIDSSTKQHDPIEREANRFAVEFLMPERLVIRRFEEIFGHWQLSLNEATWFELFGSSANYDPTRAIDVRSVTKRLAAIDRFSGAQHISLASQFGVSVDAMAIRLEELKLFVG
ncbi:ImmA/IrrE family metallo-endopeptidase [Aquabacterium humicola]|uniref:ImmA/IrrE family metallo-endopeptidase n=1 Tax=Aquabacterium humicola TaxID=3237377 RepID=UPI002543B6AA|nr:ImmA/IrrE family metallo-endopeptidase [Rubrivivax pictus]